VSIRHQVSKWIGQ